MRKHPSFTLIKILKKEKVKKFAEIGVWKSHSVKDILKHIPDLEEYWAVDPWDANLAYYRTQKRRTEKEWFQMYWYCCRLMTYFPELRVLKMTSEQASTIFPDDYFDMVYIDGIHTFEHVYADVGYWLPKVRKGGLISGHDYGHSKFPEVKEAVDKWFGEENIEVWRRRIWIKRIE
jgi:hypothetical protein